MSGDIVQMQKQTYQLNFMYQRCTVDADRAQFTTPLDTLPAKSQTSRSFKGNRRWVTN